MGRGRRGQSLVELGMVLPLLLLLMAGVVDLAHVFSVAGILQNAAREGARWGATFHPTDSAAVDDIKDRVVQEAAGSPLTLVPSEISVNPNSGVANSGDPVTITVTHQVDLLLTQVEQQAGLPAGHIGIEAQIETARGLINVEEICAASPRLETIIFGPADFAASMEMPVLTGGVQIPEYPGDHFHYVFSKILMAGRANGLQVIDGPYLRIKDSDGFRDFATRTRILGYDGKWVLHPDQVTVCNEVYTPTQEQFDRANDILDAYRKATEGDRLGAVMFGDEMIDEASRKMATKFVTRGERAGMSRSATD